MINEKYSMVQECTDSYEVTDLSDGTAEIFIKVPKTFPRPVDRKTFRPKNDRR